MIYLIIYIIGYFITFIFGTLCVKSEQGYVTWRDILQGSVCSLVSWLFILFIIGYGIYELLKKIWEKEGSGPSWMNKRLF